jgi:citrate synthase
MINGRLTATEAADRLGVKPQTLYAYVSRGLLEREKTARGSTFDPRQVARLARSSRHGGGGARATSTPVTPFNEPIFVTELTLIEGGRLYYRGQDAVRLSRHRGFEEVSTWLWTGDWPETAERWRPRAAAMKAVAAVLRTAGASAQPVERFAVAVTAAALTDDLRHDLNPAGVPVTGRALLCTLVESLNVVGPVPDSSPDPSLSERLWPRLSALPVTPERARVLDAALVLVADHELAPSTLAARVAASFRADPYAVVMTGLGPASGSWPPGSSGAPSEVEALLAEAAASDAHRALGERLRRTGATPHGFGMPLYADGDPRGAELLSRLPEIGGSAGRLAVVRQVVDIGRSRGFPPANVDMGLGALAFCAEMIPGAGQAISTLGKVAGWLAHAMEEYANPTQFRSRADYVGNRPEAASA